MIKELSQETKKLILDLWIKCKEDFEFCSKISFDFQRSQRKKILNQLIALQSKFVDFLQRKDRGIQNYLDEQLEELRKFIIEKQGIKLKENISAILEKASTVSYGLWKVLEVKKDENLDEFQNISSSKSLGYEIHQDIKKSQSFLQSIVSRFIQISQIIIYYSYYISYQELPQINEDFFIAIDPSLVNEEPVSIIESIVKTASEYIKNSNFKEKLSKEIANSEWYIDILEREKENSLFLIRLVKYWSIIIIYENTEQFKKVSEKMDDLIVIAIKDENDLLQKTMKEIKTDLNNDFKLKEKYIIDELNLSKYVTTDYISFPILDLFSESFPKDLTKNHLLNLTNVFKCMTTEENIDIERFYEILIVQIKQHSIPEVYSKIPSLKILGNNEVNNENKINWMKFLIMISLGNYFIPNKNDLFEWKNQLVKKQTTFKEINSIDFIQSKTWVECKTEEEKKDLTEKLEFISYILTNIDNTISIDKAIEMVTTKWKEEDIEGKIFWDYVFDVRKVE